MSKSVQVRKNNRINPKNQKRSRVGDFGHARGGAISSVSVRVGRMSEGAKVNSYGTAYNDLRYWLQYRIIAGKLKCQDDSTLPPLSYRTILLQIQ
jgi:hypothetical protein